MEQGYEEQIYSSRTLSPSAILQKCLMSFHFVSEFAVADWEG
jgi:hypothetical protein